jgi:hypothetical protein
MTSTPNDPDPQDVVESLGYAPPVEGDPTDPEVTDPEDPNYVEPASNAKKPPVVFR